MIITNKEIPKKMIELCKMGHIVTECRFATSCELESHYMPSDEDWVLLGEIDNGVFYVAKIIRCEESL